MRTILFFETFFDNLKINIRPSIGTLSGENIFLGYRFARD